MKYLLGIILSQLTPSKKTVIQKLYHAAPNRCFPTLKRENFFLSTLLQKHLSPLAMFCVQKIMI